MRRRWPRLLATGLGVALLLLLAAPPASAALPPILKVSKHKSGPYVDEQIVIHVGKDEQKDFFLKARSPENPASATLVLVSDTFYKTRFFKGDRNITPEVKGDGFVFTLQPTAKKFRVVVRDGGEAPTPDCVFVRLEFNPALYDQAEVGVNGGCF